MLAQRDVQLVVGLTVLAAVVRFATLGFQSFDHEEAVTAGGVLQPSLSATLSQTLLTERSGPPYYVLAWGWTRVFGTDPVGLRSLSALAGTLTVPAAFGFASTLVNRKTGLLAAALVAFNPDLIWYSQEGRSYALFVFLSTVGLFCFARAFTRPAGRAFSSWAVASSLAMAVHYFAGFLVAGQAVWLLLGRARRPAALAIAAMVPVALLLVRLAFLQQGDHPLGLAGHGGVVPVGDTIHHSLGGRVAETAMKFVTGEQLGLGASVLGRLQLVALGLTVVALVLSAWGLWRAEDPPMRRGALVSGTIGLLVFGLPVLLALAGLDLVKTRNLVGAIVPLTVFLACGLAYWLRGRRGFVAAGVACSLSLALTVVTLWTPVAQRPDWAGVARLIGRPDGLRLLVVTRTADDILPLYMRKSDARVLATRKRELEGATVAGYPASALPVSEVVVASDGARTGEAPPGFRLVERQDFRQFTVRRYRSSSRRNVDALTVDSKAILAGPRSLLIDGRPPAGRR